MDKNTKKQWYDDACGTALALELVGERWSLLIVRELLLGGLRFSDLRAGLSGLSANVLTQRLHRLEGAGIVRRRRLPPPASVQVYELTAWGMEAEPVVMALARWALRSPAHDPMLHFSPVALLLSLKMLLVPERVGDFAARVGFRLGVQGFVAEIADGAMTAARDDLTHVDAVLSADVTNAFLPVFYGGMPLAGALAAGMVRLEGDGDVATRFSRLFSLPPKAAVD
ncbi:MAG: winged helix-turn-helix transcriptional regulator [Pseudomonadota bacterium]